jgi:signal transduction histidine kinase
LGLSICRTIVSAHGGELRHEPRSGEGTTFRFTLRTWESGVMPADK